jgi:hypothetical protein
LRILVTSSRMPFALGMVRKLASEGHEVFAADDYSLSPGSHSKYLSGHFVYPSPRSDTAGFIGELERIAKDNAIDVIVPAFEEVFYLSTQLDRVQQFTNVFASPFSTLVQLHDKGAFEQLVTKLGLPIPQTVIVSSDQELEDTTESMGKYFARAAFSRGGVSCLTNTGPLAGALNIEDIHPTPESPWLVQPFVEGETVCSYSTAHEGKVTSHLLYRIPRQWKHATGIGFESIDANEALRLIEPVIAELGYTGEISFDFIITEDGLSYVECNPRPTDGVLLMPRDELAKGILEPASGETFVLEPGGHVQLDLAVLADGFADHLKRLPDTIQDLAQVKDAGNGWHDPMPTLYSALAVAHFAGQSLREHKGLFEAMAGDMNWDGEPIDGMSDADAKLLTGLRPS